MSRIFAHMCAIDLLSSGLSGAWRITVSYFRTHFQTFEEFKREGFFDTETLGKEEIELLRDLEDAESFDRPRRRRSEWD